MTEQVVEQQQADEPQLSTQDLVMVVRLVDMAAARGAITGDDLEAVGGLRRRFVEFLRVNAPEVFQAPAEESDVIDGEAEEVVVE